MIFDDAVAMEATIDLHTPAAADARRDAAAARIQACFRGWRCRVMHRRRVRRLAAERRRRLEHEAAGMIQTAVRRRLAERRVYALRTAAAAEVAGSHGCASSMYSDTTSAGSLASDTAAIAVERAFACRLIRRCFFAWRLRRALSVREPPRAADTAALERAARESERRYAARTVSRALRTAVARRRLNEVSALRAANGLAEAMAQEQEYVEAAAVALQHNPWAP